MAAILAHSTVTASGGCLRRTSLSSGRIPSPASSIPSSFSGSPLSVSLSSPAALPFPSRIPMGSSSSASAADATFSGKTLHDFEVEDINGRKVSLGEYKGKLVLIVNIPSHSAITDSLYIELQELYDKYKWQGLAVLAFPSTQFSTQEPYSNAEIQKFLRSRYKATFPLFAKVDVNGPGAAPVYQFLKSQEGGGIFQGSNIQGDFVKFLVDKEGKVVKRYFCITPSSSIEDDIKELVWR